MFTYPFVIIHITSFYLYDKQFFPKLLITVSVLISSIVKAKTYLSLLSEQIFHDICYDI